MVYSVSIWACVFFKKNKVRILGNHDNICVSLRESIINSTRFLKYLWKHHSWISWKQHIKQSIIGLSCLVDFLIGCLHDLQKPCFYQCNFIGKKWGIWAPKEETKDWSSNKLFLLKGVMTATLLVSLFCAQIPLVVLILWDKVYSCSFHLS